MEDINDADYRYTKRVWENFGIKSIIKCLYVWSNTVLLVDVFGNKYLERNEHDPAHFPTEPVLAWQAALKKLKLDLLIDTNMLLLVEGGTRGGICLSIHRYVKANSKSWKDYKKNK